MWEKAKFLVAVPIFGILRTWEKEFAIWWGLVLEIRGS